MSLDWQTRMSYLLGRRDVCAGPQTVGLATPADHSRFLVTSHTADGLQQATGRYGETGVQEGGVGPDTRKMLAPVLQA